MKYNKSTRRMFLQGSGGAFVAIPFLSSLLPRELWAQTSPTVIKRLVTVANSYDIGHNSNWLPTNGTEAEFGNIPQPNRIVAGVNGHHDVHYQPLRELAPNSSSVLARLYGTAINPYLDHMNILRSLDVHARYGHGFNHILGALAPNTTLKKVPTIDYVLNNNIKFNPNKLPLIVRQNGGDEGVMSQSISGSSVVTSSNTGGFYFSELYNAMFSNGSLPESGQAAAVHPRAGVMNRVMDDYNRVRSSKNISKEDKLVLDNVFDKFSDIQKGFTQVATAQCKHKDFFASRVEPAKAYNVYHSETALVGKAFADLVTAAFMCDSVRTLTYMGSMEEIWGTFDGYAFDHQITSHEPFTVTGGKYQWQRICDRQACLLKYFVLPLVQNLSSVTEASNGKSILYNSLINVNYEAGQVHSWASVPTILFGNAGGNIKSGNYIDYANRTKGAFEGVDSGETLFNKTPGNIKFSNNWYGVSHSRLHVTILQAMGLSPSDYEDNSLNAQVYNRTDLGDTNKNLTSLGGYGHLVAGAIDGRPSWDDVKGPLKNYDLTQFKYKLPIL